MPDYLDHLKAAITALEQELERDPRHATLRELRRVLAAAQGEPGSDLPSAPTPIRSRPSSARTMSPETVRIVGEADDFLSGRTTPVPLRELYHELVEVRGCHIGGKNPINGLSAILSTRGFVPVGRAGWLPRGSQRSDPSSEAEDDPAERQAKLLAPQMSNGELHASY